MGRQQFLAEMPETDELGRPATAMHRPSTSRSKVGKACCATTFSDRVLDRALPPLPLLPERLARSQYHQQALEHAVVDFVNTSDC
jgi:hypothetical protein